jgi:hypothetical protein
VRTSSGQVIRPEPCLRTYAHQVAQRVGRMVSRQGWRKVRRVTLLVTAMGVGDATGKRGSSVGDLGRHRRTGPSGLTLTMSSAGIASFISKRPRYCGSSVSSGSSEARARGGRQL